jgi:2-isopropylmalate synthase
MDCAEPAFSKRLGEESFPLRRRILVYDTTLRDGSQGEGVNFSVRDKILLTKRLITLGFDYIEGGFPASNQNDYRYFREVRYLDTGNSQICAFGMTRRKNVGVEDDPAIRTLLECQLGVVTIVGKASAFHVTRILETSLEENLAMVSDTVRYLREHGCRVFFDAEHFFDGWKEDPDYTWEVIKTAAESGAEVIVLCDTNGGSLPEEVGAFTREVVSRLSVPVGIHCHNDGDLAVANSLAAVDGGAIQVQGTINGIGERCGNADLIAVVANLAFKKGDRYEVLSPGAIRQFTDLSRFVYELANLNFRSQQPFVGRSAFAHKGGMHASGVNRDTRAYEHIDPAWVGNERRILVSELSGRSNIIARLRKYGLQNESELAEKILAAVVAKEAEGYQFEAADGSFDLLVRRCAGLFQPHFRRLNYHVDIRPDFVEGLKTEATVELEVGGEVEHVVAKGDGPVDALDRAFRKALLKKYPNLAEMNLVDYKVRVINFEAHTAARVRVLIESQDQDEIWGTVGVNENIIEASLLALMESYEYKLCKDEDRRRNGQNPAERRSPEAEVRDSEGKMIPQEIRVGSQS